MFASISSVNADSNSTKIVFACAELPENMQNYFQKIYGTAFAELGMEFEMVPLGLARAMQEADKGTVDGLCGKIAMFKDMPIATDLIQIPTPLLSSQIALWVLDKNEQSFSDISAQKNNYSVTYQRGSLASEYYVKKYALTNIVTTWSKDDALQLVLNEKVDAMISGDLFVYQYNAKSVGNTLARVSNVETLDMFPFIHKRHQTIAQDVEEAINNALEKHGLFEEK
ncbi:hypothetical protein KUL49_20620 [Alteromonas sp. KUL49]|nr:hypothetical protein KUL49_20620 [Alteromonas sp. KUL49]